MGRVFAALVAVLLTVSVGWAGETIEGTIKSVDASGQVVTLEDGTQLRVPPGVVVEPFTLSADSPALREGARVKASYDQRDGQKVVTSIEVKKR